MRVEKVGCGSGRKHEVPFLKDWKERDGTTDIVSLFDRKGNRGQGFGSECSAGQHHQA